MSCITVVLGAGASRGVKYAHLGQVVSPLDSDFFDLLHRLKPQDKDVQAVDFVLNQVSLLPSDLRSSLERAFYTLHLRAYLKRKLSGATDTSEEAKVVRCFAHATEALLREAHGQATCGYHKAIVRKLGPTDAIISFNYDLVVERALRSFAVAKKVSFGGHIYRFPGGSDSRIAVPQILKLHGSSNWKLDEKGFSTGTSWEEFDQRPYYLRHKSNGTQFPIFLPFWDKDIQRKPWLHLWTQAYLQLQLSDTLIVWGYSLAPTDVKARQLFSISVPDSGASLKLCVIDPSSATRQRWRDLYPRARIWEYNKVTEFLEYPPTWWSEIGS